MAWWNRARATPGRVDAALATSAGPRPENQDRALALDGLLVVADGMGGYAGGAVAAELCVAAVRERLTTGRVEEADVAAAFRAANHAVRERRAADLGLAAMGATLTVAVAVDDDAGRWLVAGVGDSPGFVVSGGDTTQITVDDTVPGQLLHAGAISELEARTHPYKHMVLHAVGVDPSIEVATALVALGEGDSLVLVSDGVSDVLDAAAIGRPVHDALTAAAAAAALVAAAEASGTADNATAVVGRRVASSPG